MTQLTIRRGSCWPDYLRRYTIRLDGSPVGKLARDSKLTVEVSPGPHEVRATIDWCSSESLRFIAPAAGNLEVEVASNIQGPRMLLVFWILLFARHSYLKLNLGGGTA